MTDRRSSRVAELVRVTKRFGAVCALDGLSLDVDSDTTVAVLGPNGAGKSTLIALLLGLRRPDAGVVRLLGENPRLGTARAAVGYAPQEVGFPPTLKVREIAALVARHFPAAPDPADLLDRFGILQIAGRQAGGLSGGQRRRLAVALAFLGRPRLIVLDEPTAGLDSEGRRAVWTAIDSARRRGSAVLLATHHLDEAEGAASRVVAVARGRVVADGTVAEIKARAGLTRVSIASPPGHDVPSWLAPGPARNGRVSVDVTDAGALVERLVREGVPLSGLEVRPLGLEEALDALLETEAR